MILGRHARIDLDRDLCSGTDGKGVRQYPKEPDNLLGPEMGWCSAAPMNLCSARCAGNHAANDGDLRLDRVEEAARALFVLRDDPVARTEVTQAAAEGNVDVQREATFFVAIERQELLAEIARTKMLGPDRRRGIARVARYRSQIAG